MAVLGTHWAKPAMCLFFLRFYTICPFIVLSISPLEKDSLKTLLWNKQLRAHTGRSRPGPTEAQGELTPEHLYSVGIQRLQIYHARPGGSSSPTGVPYLPFNPSTTDQVTSPKHLQTPE